MFDIVTLTFDLLIKNSDPGYTFLFVCNNGLLFHMNVPCDKTFPKKLESRGKSMKTVQEPKKLHKANAIKLSQSKYF
jgi:hypothetical protein